MRKSSPLNGGGLAKLNALTSLRFFAAFAIVIEHTKAAFHATSWITYPIPYDYGVSFFFVLSGFILTYKHSQMGSLRDAYEFYVARVARIWPLHLVTFALCLAIIPERAWFVGSQSEHWLRISAANLFLVQAWIPAPGFFFSFNAVAWSISAEIFFYLMFPLLRNRWSTTWHWKSLLVLFISCAILTIATSRGLSGADFSKPMQMSSTGIGYISPFTRIMEFVCGMIAALGFSKFDATARANRYAWTAVELLAVGAIPAMWLLTRNLPGRIAGHDLGDTAWPVFAAHCGSFVAFGALVLVMALGRGMVSKWISVLPLMLLGEASFALYLVHQIIISYFYLNLPMFNGIPDAVLFTGYWAIAIGSSFLLLHFVEIPSRNSIRRALDPSKRTASRLAASK